jgi:hypothetical protein
MNLVCAHPAIKVCFIRKEAALQYLDLLVLPDVQKYVLYIEREHLSNASTKHMQNMNITF